MTTTAATTLVSSAETSASIATKSSRDSASTMAVVQPRTYSIFVGYLIMWQAHYRYAQMFSVLSKKATAARWYRFAARMGVSR